MTNWVKRPVLEIPTDYVGIVQHVPALDQTWDAIEQLQQVADKSMVAAVSDNDRAELLALRNLERAVRSRISVMRQTPLATALRALDILREEKGIDGPH